MHFIFIYHCATFSSPPLQLLPKKVTREEQQEILSLLCKVHELEIENMEMQSSCMLRNFELRKKDLVVVKYEQHRTLCNEIIQQQRALMDENKVYRVANYTR